MSKFSAHTEVARLGNSAREAHAVASPVQIHFFLHAAQKFPL